MNAPGPYTPSFDTVMRRARRQYVRQERRRRARHRAILTAAILTVALTVGVLWGLAATHGRAPVLHAQLVAQCHTAQTDATDTYQQAVQARNGFLQRWQPTEPGAHDCANNPQTALDSYRHEGEQAQALVSRLNNA